MRVIERSEYRDEDGVISLQNRVRGSLRFGFPWYGVMRAQQTVTDRLNKSLSNDYHLLRNVLVPGSGVIVSLTLIGPQGVYAILPSPSGGVFRAKDDEWLSHSGGHFRPARPNLQQGALAAADLLLQYFHKAGYDLPQVEAVLMFTDPRAHVDTVHPRARVVLADALEHFAANLREQPPIMDREDAQLLIDALLHPPEPKVEPAPAPAAPPPLPASAVAPATSAGPFQLEERKVPAAPRPARRRRRGLRRREVVLLGAMLVVEICILAAFAVLVFYPGLLG
ncbi:MAG TPA: hypothetical protein VK449_00315 [Anaerolineales bacterium]|nr:hypothetical protein [Anaerolineales bacterium]